MSDVRDAATAEALDALHAAAGALLEAGVDPHDADDARTLIGEVEAVAQRVRAAQVEVVDAIERTGVHKSDGHASAKVMVRHVANLSDPEAARRGRAAKTLRQMPEVRDAFRAGRIGGCQVDRIARAHANPRIRGAVEANDAAFATRAEEKGYRLFDREVTSWANLVDQDGPRDRDQRNHENRDVKMTQEFDGSWRIAGTFGSLQGAELHGIFEAFGKMEFDRDWKAARAEHGEAATTADLARTANQRRADAFAEIFRRAADHHAGSDGGSQIVTDIVIDHDTFERITRDLAGDHADTSDIDTSGIDEVLAPFPAPQYRCSTIDGHPVEPTAAVADALVGHVRRVVVGSDSVVIDMGRKSRCFTGAAALAVKLSNETCYWPGCHVPVTDCQCDHLTPWTEGSDGSPGGGCTCPGNGGPGCGKHNRFKHRHRYTTSSAPDGTWIVRRPDGSRVE